MGLRDENWIIYVGINSEGNAKWNGNDGMEICYLFHARKYTYYKAREICSKSEEGWVAFPESYIETFEGPTIHRRDLRMTRGRAWRGKELKSAQGVNLMREMKNIKKAPILDSDRKNHHKSAQEVFGDDVKVYTVKDSESALISDEDRETEFGTITDVPERENNCDSCKYSGESYFTPACEFCIGNGGDGGIMCKRNFKSK